MVEVQLSTEGETIQTPEQAEAQLAQQQAEEREAQAPDPEPAEPELPEGFKSWADVAAALKETKSALTKAQQAAAEAAKGAGEGDGEGTDEGSEAKDAVTKLYDAIGPFVEKFNSGQELTDEDFAQIERDTGFPRQFIDQQLRGAIAYQNARAEEVYQLAGGSAETYGQMLDWAKTYMPESTLREFDAALETDNLDRIKFAVQGLYAAYQQAGGGAPTLMLGDAPSSGLVEPIGTQDELVRLMNDPRYLDGDQKFIHEVMRRVAASPNLYA